MPKGTVAGKRAQQFLFSLMQGSRTLENKIFIQPEMCYTDCKQEIVASPAGEKWLFTACIR